MKPKRKNKKYSIRVKGVKFRNLSFKQYYTLYQLKKVDHVSAFEIHINAKT